MTKQQKHHQVERDARILAARDFQVECHGSIWLFRPLTEVARKHLEDVAAACDEIQFFGNAMVVEPRYVDGVALGLARNGFNV
jgi:hypothetical protein